MDYFPSPVRESGTEFLGKNNRTAVSDFLQDLAENGAATPLNLWG
jgi:hypothetical protein